MAAEGSVNGKTSGSHSGLWSETHRHYSSLQVLWFHLSHIHVLSRRIFKISSRFKPLQLPPVSVMGPTTESTGWMLELWWLFGGEFSEFHQLCESFLWVLLCEKYGGHRLTFTEGLLYAWGCAKYCNYIIFHVKRIVWDWYYSPCFIYKKSRG